MLGICNLKFYIMAIRCEFIDVIIPIETINRVYKVDISNFGSTEVDNGVVNGMMVFYTEWDQQVRVLTSY